MLLASALSLASLWGAGAAGAAADNSTCFGCHGDSATAPSQTIAGKTVSLYVDPAAYAATAHGAKACTRCHGDTTEAHDTTQRTYGSWARFSASASTDTAATWNFWRVSGDKCVSCHTDASYAAFFASDHATAWNMAHTPSGADRTIVDVIGSDGLTYHTDQNYTEAECGSCHMQQNCGTCHWKTPVITNPSGTATGGITDLLDLWTDFSAPATIAKTALSESAIDWTQNIASHDFRSAADLKASNVVCDACHQGFLETPDASVPALGISGPGYSHGGQSSELRRSGARGVHETLQQCTDCHSSLHDLTAPQSQLQWRQTHDVDCLDCHPTRQVIGVGVPHQTVTCSACHADGVAAMLDPDGGGAGAALVIPRAIRANLQQGRASHDLRRDTDCLRCHVEGGAQTGAPPWSAITAIDVHKDVTAPVTRALAAVTVTRYTNATFKYRVDEVQSTKATVTIRIRKGDRLVRVIKPGLRRVNLALTTRAKISLPAGKYTWTVYATDAAGNPQAAPAGTKALTVKPAKPPIVRDFIPFGDTRKAQMASYALRHYGISTWKIDAKVIVLHYTVSSSYPGVHATFASNAANRGEKPGVVAQFVIDKDGTIYQQIPLDAMGRHVIGLNHVAIGIEFVQEGASNAEDQIMARDRQISAGLRLVAWLQATYGISAANVIGHGTANGSPFFKDLEGWRNDHSDWGAADMKKFRALLADAR